MKAIPPFHRFILWLIVCGFSGAVLVLAGIYLYISPTLPDAEDLLDIELQTPLRVYSADGALITEFGEKRRTPIQYSDIPTEFVDALTASEDERFFEHSGIEIKGLLRATFQLVTTGQKKSGGSTITMQVARNYYLTRKKTFTRKFTEILLALKIEQSLSKEQIFELYINKVYLGKRAYGIEAASQVYYGKSINELSLSQLAMIAGLPQAPSAANPINSPKRAIQRRNYVLNRMLSLDKITQEEFDTAANEPSTASYHGATSELSAPYVAEMVRKYMLRRFGNAAYTSGFKVYTTINSTGQIAANQALQKGLLKYDRDHGYREAEQTGYPVVKLEVPLIPELEEWMNAANEEHDIDWPSTLFEWKQAIAAKGTNGLLQSGIVAKIKEDGAWVATLDNFIWLPYEGIKWAAPYLSVNSKGEPPQTTAELLSAGQMIWLEDTNTGYKLAQMPEIEGALVSMNPHNGAIEALVGGFSDAENQLNRVIQSQRQPGSSFKPFIYSAALENGLTTASIINDAPVVFEDSKLESVWRPENYSGKFYGPTRLREALYRSQNLVSIRVLKQMGISPAIRHVETFGFNRAKLNRDLSMALGSSAVSPLGLAEGYSVFANGGYAVSAYIIDRIETDDGDLIYKATPEVVPDCIICTDDSEEEQLAEATEQETAPAEDEMIELPTYARKVLDDRNRFLTVSMMQDVIRKGTGRKALVLRRNDLAGKTGTTNDQKDTWFSGFTPNLVTTVWVGFDQPQTLGRRASGGSTALPIWIDYMKTALKDKPEGFYSQPPGIVSVRIDPKTGLLARPGQTDAVFEYFREENAPKEFAKAQEANIFTEESGDAGIAVPEQLF